MDSISVGICVHQPERHPPFKPIAILASASTLTPDEHAFLFFSGCRKLGASECQGRPFWPSISGAALCPRFVPSNSGHQKQASASQLTPLNPIFSQTPQNAAQTPQHSQPLLPKLPHTPQTPQAPQAPQTPAKTKRSPNAPTLPKTLTQSPQKPQTVVELMGEGSQQ